MKGTVENEAIESSTVRQVKQKETESSFGRLLLHHKHMLSFSIMAIEINRMI